jgi:hypothetical protein
MKTTGYGLTKLSCWLAVLSVPLAPFSQVG